MVTLHKALSVDSRSVWNMQEFWQCTRSRLWQTKSRKRGHFNPNLTDVHTSVHVPSRVSLTEAEKSCLSVFNPPTPASPRSPLPSWVDFFFFSSQPRPLFCLTYITASLLSTSHDSLPPLHHGQCHFLSSSLLPSLLPVVEGMLGFWHSKHFCPSCSPLLPSDHAFL